MNTGARYDLQRANMARDEFCLWRLGDLPTIYRSMIPPTYNAQELLEAEKAVRQMYAADQAIYANNPWGKAGPIPQLLDWSGVEGSEQVRIGLESTPAKGMPDTVRPGFMEHPDVLAAFKRVEQSPEFIKEVGLNRLEAEIIAAHRKLTWATDHPLEEGQAPESGYSNEEIAKFRAEIERLQGVKERLSSIPVEEYVSCNIQLDPNWVNPLDGK